ncbi:MAG: hypothetical protein MUC35_03645 [Candidatus Margulisbacteria bacterium]|jgi:hypothetical protein|nr:hypothetical protein [Candidatus Margulisiibacteriota bacterium]
MAANLGKVLPRFYDIGRLTATIGPYRLTDSARTQVPLRGVQYASLNVMSALFSYSHIRDSGQIEVAPDSTVELDQLPVEMALCPPSGMGAVLLQREQLAAKVWQPFLFGGEAGDRFREDLQSVCQWVVLLPYLARGDDHKVFGFTLAAAGIRPLEIATVFSGEPEIAQIVASENVLFIAPFSQGDGLFAANYQFDLFKGLSHLVGLAKAAQTMPGASADSLERVALVYATAVNKSWLGSSISRYMHK